MNDLKSLEQQIERDNARMERVRIMATAIPSHLEALTQIAQAISVAGGKPGTALLRAPAALAAATKAVDEISDEWGQVSPSSLEAIARLPNFQDPGTAIGMARSMIAKVSALVEHGRGELARLLGIEATVEKIDAAVKVLAMKEAER